MNNLTQCILVILLFISNQFAYNAQTLDATFSSPNANQCPDNLFTLNATNTTYGNSNYTWLITGPNGYSQNPIGSSVAVYLTVSGFYDVKLIVTDGVTTASNIQNSFIQVYNNPIINYSVTPTTGCSPLLVTFDGSCSAGSGTFTPTSFSVNAGDGLTYTTEDISHSYNSSGTFTPSVAISNSFGCITTGNLSAITINPIPTFTLSKTDPSTCNGTNGSILISGLLPYSSYQCSYDLLGVTTGPISATSNSSGQIIFSGLGAGSYTLSVIIITTSCQSATQVVNLVNPSPPDINDIQDQVICGSSYILPTITGSNLPGNQAYYTGPNGTGSVLPIGAVISTTSTIYIYTSTIGGCIDQESFTITINPLPTITLSSSSVCVNSTVQLTPSTGGTWVSNNSSIATVSGSGLVTGVSPGIVSFTFTNTITGCSNTSSSLTVTSNATVNSIPNQVVCAGTLTTPITFTGSGQQYNWTNDNSFIGLTTSGTGNIAAFTATNNALINQIATITVTPISSGCNSTPTTFTITVKPISTVNDPQDQVLCANNSTQIINFSGAVLTTNYNWTNDNQSIGLTSSGSGDIPSFLGQNNSTTNQTANLSVTPILDGCVGTTQTFTIIVKPIPILNPVLDETVCQNSSTQTIVFSSSNPGTVYNWTQDSPSIGCAGSGSTNFIPSFVAQNTTTAPQIATFIVAPSLNGCLGTAINFTITVNPSSTVDPIPDQVVCAGSLTTPITFSGTAQQYSWTNDNTSVGLAASGTGNIAAFIGTNPVYENVSTITVTPLNYGCTATSTTFTITVKFVPTVFPVVDQIICQGQGTQTIYFSGTNPNTTYEWVHNNQAIGLLSLSGSGIIPSFPAQNTSSFPLISTFTVTPSLNGCYGDTVYFSITVMPLPTVYASPDQSVCHNAATQAVNFYGAVSNTDFNWTQNNGSIGFSQSGTGNIPSFQAQNPSSGSQIANFIVTPFLDGCTGISDTFSITVNPLPIINAGNDITLCYGATFTPIATGTAITISWNNGVVQGISFTPTVTETYIVTGTNMNCYNSDSITVTINALPQLTISAFDGEDSLACDGTLTALVTDGTAPYSYTWINGASNYTTSAIQDLCSGTYSLSVVDANGCSATNSATINDTLIQNVIGDTLIFTDNIYQDSTIIGADTSAWIENCTFDYSLVTGATIDSYIDSGDSTIVTWIIALSTGSTVSVDATYFMSLGTTGVYDLTLQLYCSAKSGPKFIIASSRLYYEASTIGIETHSLNTIYLYPNPTKSTLSISGINTNFSYKISDLQGKLLKLGANEKQIEIENLPAGTYVIGISTDSEVKQLRFVKL